ncbi:uncharacterized protein LOC121929246 [Sceloporus undulatus]|uniref:uncharacterized protein LOC121929246 n=1 Tax=Sceloporus undulatus TaxID=8520 RepID=UPI001C4CF54D|nr:uncharacterized protein LOC121929246 [Sceloporus undulatus]
MPRCLQLRSQPGGGSVAATGGGSLLTACCRGQGFPTDPVRVGSGRPCTASARDHPRGGAPFKPGSLDPTSLAGVTPSSVNETDPPSPLRMEEAPSHPRKISNHDGVPPVGGRLQGFAPAWERSMTDRWVLDPVRQGYKLEFHHVPRDLFIPSPKSSDPDQHRLLLEAIDHLVAIQAIEPVPDDQKGLGCYSAFFLVPKKNGSWRAILNLRPVNQFVRKRKFRMETLKSIMDSLQPDNFLSSVDLQDAYLHILIHPSSRHFLHFKYGSHHFQYRALPFGLSSAPRVFTKVMVALVTHWRTQ